MLSRRVAVVIVTAIASLQFAAAATAQAPPWVKLRKSKAERDFLRSIGQETPTEKGAVEATRRRGWIILDSLIGLEQEGFIGLEQEGFQSRSGNKNNNVRPWIDPLSRRNPWITLDSLPGVKSESGEKNLRRGPLGWSHEVISPRFRPGRRGWSFGVE